MNATRTYHWKNLNLDKTYSAELLNETSQVNTTNVDFSFIKKYFKDYPFIDDFTNYYEAILISNKHKKLIDDLLESYNLVTFQKEFYILSAIIQKEYLNYYENPVDSNEALFQDFQNESKELKILFEVLKLKIENGNQSINSITFDIGGRKKISNFFVAKEILERLITSFGLTKENFDTVAKNYIDSYNHNDLNVLDEFNKWEIIKGLYQFILSTTEYTADSRYLEFIIIFLHISQVPININQFEISNSNSIGDYFDEDIIKYLRLTLKRPKKFFIKV